MNKKEEIILNPISEHILKCIENAEDKLFISVPFLSSFAKVILKKDSIDTIRDKRIITKFDETNINTFNIPTLQYLLSCGFKICFNNKIHLKHYIIDNHTFITSSNLTKSGFEDNIELTVKIDTDNSIKSIEIFENLWKDSFLNLISEDLLNKNLSKYEILKKKHRFYNEKEVQVQEKHLPRNFNVNDLVNEIFKTQVVSKKKLNTIYEANKKRNLTKNKLTNSIFDISLFYSKQGHTQRYESLFYDFAYGIESELAGTGLREAQFSEVFEHKNFKTVISYIYPEILGFPAWNFEDKKELQAFCTGLFDFNIPQYSETLPIRLASYFYPEKFLPIFKLEHLKMVCDILGLKTNAKTKGEKLFAYTTFLENKMKDIPFDNYIKSNISYHILYAIELYNQLSDGEKFIIIKNKYKQEWKKKYLVKGMQSLKNIKAI